MHATLQVPPSLDLERHPLSAISDHRQGGVTPTGIPGPRVLLVGQELSWGISLLRSLERLTCEFLFALPRHVTSEYVREGECTIVLIDTTVPSEFRRELACGLTGSTVSVFYAYPVENGCWWVPALLSGQDCHGSPAFRTNQFFSALQDILQGWASEVPSASTRA